MKKELGDVLLRCNSFTYNKLQLPQFQNPNRDVYLANREPVLIRKIQKNENFLKENAHQAVKRNTERFPRDFMFILTKQEAMILRSQIVTSRWGGRRYLPYAFTEQGVAMLSSVLNSKRAIQVNIAIIRAFVKLRQILSTHKDLAHKLKELERKFGQHDKQIIAIFEAIRQLMKPPPKKSQNHR